METKYSKTEFDGYTHRFIVELETIQPEYHKMNIYSNSGSYLDLENFICAKKSDKVISFKITHRATKEQDELSTKFINEFLNEI